MRVELTRAAAADDPLLEVSEIEVRREGPSYTFRTLEQLAGERPDEELWLLLGADAAAGFEHWRRPERILELARLAVAVRPGIALGEAESAIAAVGGSERAEWIRMPEIGISSSEIRTRIASGQPLRHLVPDGVAELIARRGLYRVEARV